MKVARPARIASSISGLAAFCLAVCVGLGCGWSLLCPGPGSLLVEAFLAPAQDQAIYRRQTLTLLGCEVGFVGSGCGHASLSASLSLEEAARGRIVSGSAGINPRRCSSWRMIQAAWILGRRYSRCARLCSAVSSCSRRWMMTFAMFTSLSGK
jgi:hypothetical protein